MSALNYLTNIASVATVVSGSGFPTKFQGSSEGQYPFYKVGDMNSLGNETHMHHHKHAIDEGIRELLGAKVCPAGTIIFPKVGAAIHTNKKRVLTRPGCFDNNVMGICPFENTDPAYLFHAMQNVDLRTIANSGNPPSIRKTTVEALLIPVPPMQEQKRITAILDKADELKAKRQQAIDELDKLQQAVFLDMFGDPVTNPRGWPSMPLRALLDEIEGGWSPRCSDASAEETEWGVLKLGSVSYGNYSDIENKALPSTLEPKTELEVQSGDLLFVRKNTYELVGASAYVFETRPKLMIPDLIFRLRLNCEDVKTSPIFLWQLLSHPGIRMRLRSLAAGAAGSMPNISKAKLSQLIVMLPPADLQLKFQTFVEGLFDTRSSLMQHSLELERLSKALSSRAFTGEL